MNPTFFLSCYFDHITRISSVDNYVVIHYQSTRSKTYHQIHQLRLHFMSRDYIVGATEAEKI